MKTTLIILANLAFLFATTSNGCDCDQLAEECQLEIQALQAENEGLTENIDLMIDNSVVVLANIHEETFLNQSPNIGPVAICPRCRPNCDINPICPTNFELAKGLVTEIIPLNANFGQIGGSNEPQLYAGGQYGYIEFSLEDQQYSGPGFLRVKRQINGQLVEYDVEVIFP